MADLSVLPRDELVARWKAAFASPPPKGISMRLMTAAMAYAIQAKRFGGLKAVTRRRLEAPIGEDRHADRSASLASISLGSGSRLVREWNGKSHVVDVVEGGYLWNGERYSSLSAIARAITGARWSGPRFFGTDRRGGR